MGDYPASSVDPSSGVVLHHPTLEVILAEPPHSVPAAAAVAAGVVLAEEERRVDRAPDVAWALHLNLHLHLHLQPPTTGEQGSTNWEGEAR